MAHACNEIAFNTMFKRFFNDIPNTYSERVRENNRAVVVVHI